MVKKNYAFYYADKETIYMQVGFGSFEDAKSKLEQIAEIFVKERANGRIDKIENRKITIKEEYNIFSENSKIRLEINR